MANSVLRIPIPGERANKPNGDSVGFDLPWFICGPENRLVELALNDLIAHATVSPTSRIPAVPLYLFGPTGCGKTHIARGLADYWVNTFGEEKIRYTTAADFACSFVAADDPMDQRTLRESYNRLSLLVLDDIDHLPQRPLAQRELLAVIDAVEQRGGLIVITASAAPGRISGLPPALRTRFSEGLVVPLAPPGMETRREMARRMASRRQMALNDQELAAVAGSVDVSPRSIARRLQQLDLVRRVGPVAHSYGADASYQALDGSTIPTLKSITAVTSRYFGISQASLRGPSRRQSIVYARGIAMYLGRELTNQSLAKIGCEYGGRDHTTVLHACHTTGKRISQNTTTRETVTKLRRILLCG